jgi:hypothetical protein
VLTGLRAADSGSVWLEGRDVIRRHGAGHRREAGLSHVPEDRNERGLVRPYTAAWNAVLGDHHRPPYANRIGLLDLPRSTTTRAPSSRGTTCAPRHRRHGQQLLGRQRAEADHGARARALAARAGRGATDAWASTSARSSSSTARSSARDDGLAVLLVSADLNEVMSLADRILVMFEGRIMGELAAARGHGRAARPADGRVPARGTRTPPPPRRRDAAAGRRARSPPTRPPDGAAAAPASPRRALLQEAAQVGRDLRELDQEGVVAVRRHDAGVARVGRPSTSCRCSTSGYSTSVGMPITKRGHAHATQHLAQRPAPAARS